MEPLTKRVTQILQDKKLKKASEPSKDAPKANPVVGALDHLYEALDDDDTTSALDVVYELTKHLGLEEAVTFEIPEDRD